MPKAGMRDDCALAMSSPSKDKQPGGRRRANQETLPDSATDQPGVLSNLPSTRPQRPSARRAAARQTAAARAERVATKPKRAATEPRRAPAKAERRVAESPPKPTAKPAPKRPAAKPAAPKRRVPKPVERPVPPQGFEAEEAIEAGHSVQPPSGAELATSMVDLVGELAQTGIATGGRMLRDALARLSGG